MPRRSPTPDRIVNASPLSRGARAQNSAAKTYITKSPTSAKKAAANQASAERMKKTYSKAKNSNAKAGAAAAAGVISGVAVGGTKKTPKRYIPPVGRGAGIAAAKKKK